MKQPINPLQDCFLVQVVVALPRFFRHSPQIFHCFLGSHYLLLPLATATVIPHPYHLHLKHLLTIILLPHQLYMFDLSCFAIYGDIRYYS